jgi:hypothetical protein
MFPVADSGCLIVSPPYGGTQFHNFLMPLSGQPPESEHDRLLRQMRANLPQLMQQAADEARQDGDEHVAAEIERLRRQKFPQINQGRSAISATLHQRISR